MTKPTIRLVQPAKTQIRLHICTVWSESLLIASAFYSFHAIQRGMNETPCHGGWMYRLIWVFAGHTGLIVDFVICLLKYQYFLVERMSLSCCYDKWQDCADTQVDLDIPYSHIVLELFFGQTKSSREIYTLENAPMEVRRSDTRTHSKPPLKTSKEGGGGEWKWQLFGGDCRWEVTIGRGWTALIIYKSYLTK